MNKRRRLFVEYYLQVWNASDAARRAGYSARSAGQRGYDLLADPEVQAAIAERIKQVVMGTDEVLLRLGEQARLNPTEFYTFEEKDGVLSMTGVDWAAVKARGNLVKSIKYNRRGQVILEFHDAQVALIQIGKHLGLFTESLDVTSKGDKLQGDDSERIARALAIIEAARARANSGVA